MITPVNHEGFCLGVFSSKEKAKREVVNLIRIDKSKPIFYQEWEVDNIEPNCWGLAFLPEGMKCAKYNAVYLSVYDGMLE